MTADKQFDVIVLGAGFGGSLLAAILSRQGMRVALLDRNRHPRFAIGESSTPAADLILDDLVERYDLPELSPLCRFGSWQAEHPALNCGCKRGFSYFWHGAGAQFRATADHACELLVAANDSREVADTHWYRRDVDQFFAQTAEKYGAVLREGIADVELRHAATNDWEVRFNVGGEQHQYDGPFLIDATGAAGTVLKYLQIGDLTDELKTSSHATYSHFTGMTPTEEWLGERGVPLGDYPYPCDQAAVHHLFDDGWFWQLRFEDGTTSVGFVERQDGSEAAPNDDPTERWRQILAAHPPMEEILRPAQLGVVPGQILTTGRLQRLAASAAGEDWAALPHTAGFIDPLHSTGIAHTLSGVERLAGRLLRSGGKSWKSAKGGKSPGIDRSEEIRALSATGAELRLYSRQVIAELRLIDRLVAGCYRSLGDFPLFAAWTMIYFAAATCYEQSRNRHRGGDPPGFLLADNDEFMEMVGLLWDDLARNAPGMIDRIREGIAPFNRVGLFEPAVPNMYHRTRAAKPEKL